WGGQDAQGSFGRFDSVFYFSQKYRVIDNVFGLGQPTKNIECLYNSRTGRNTTDPWCMQNGYPAGPDYQPVPHAMPADGGIGLAPQQVLVNFLDNHDLPRFMFEKTDPNQLRVALMYLYTWDGIPCLYYGTEQLFNGGVDPKNREDMFLGNQAMNYPPFDTTNDTFKLVQSLIKMRKDHSALRRGQVTPIYSTTTSGTGARDEGIFAFERNDVGNEMALVVLNASTQTSETCANTGNTCLHTSFPPGTTLVDVMPTSDGKTYTVAGDGTLDITVPARSGRVLVKQ
ncbi:MAG: alpha-amylase family glycosyl hydrolase, partial [Acidobacteriota bacterium]